MNIARLMCLLGICMLLVSILALIEEGPISNYLFYGGLVLVTAGLLDKFLGEEK